MKEPGTQAESVSACCLPADKVSHGKKPVHDPGNEIPSSTTSTVATVSVQGGWFSMGCEHSPHAHDGEHPVREVWVDSFRMAPTVVSNKEFNRFTEATGYVTEAEHAGSSFVFHAFLEQPEKFRSSIQAPWWKEVPGTCWQNPDGPGSSWSARPDHPAVHISRTDAQQYCRWSGNRLPFEAEWEFAARGGLAGLPYPWGKELTPGGEHRCNIWQGEFPVLNTAGDGFVGTAPVNAFPPNLYGLYNMTGNVWEWVEDKFTGLHSPRKTRNPRGPLNGEHFVAKGGSYLCHESYCLRYKTSSRQALPAGTTTGNLGFRIVAA